MVCVMTTDPAMVLVAPVSEPVRGECAERNFGLRTMGRKIQNMNVCVDVRIETTQRASQGVLPHPLGASVDVFRGNGEYVGLFWGVVTLRLNFSTEEKPGRRSLRREGAATERDSEAETWTKVWV